MVMRGEEMCAVQSLHRADQAAIRIARAGILCTLSLYKRIQLRINRKRNMEKGHIFRIAALRCFEALHIPLIPSNLIFIDTVLFLRELQAAAAIH